MPLLNLRIIKNSKGNIIKIFNRKDKNYKRFEECYISEIKTKQIKAWRYHKKNSQKILVINGKCRIVLFKNKKFLIYTLKSTNLKILNIKNKTWYGFYNPTNKKVRILNFVDKLFNEK